MSALDLSTPLRFGASGDATLVALTPTTILNIAATDFFYGVRLVTNGGNIRVAVGRAATATDPLVMANDSIVLALTPGVAAIVSVYSTGTPTVNAALLTK